MAYQTSVIASWPDLGQQHLAQHAAPTVEILPQRRQATDKRGAVLFQVQNWGEERIMISLDKDRQMDAAAVRLLEKFSLPNP
jgi:hypothetical protein